MNEQELLKESYEALARAGKRPPKQQLQELIDKGVIDEKGNVQLWDAFLAVIEIKPGSNGKRIEYFRCLKPTLGMPGAATIDVRRDSILDYIVQGKRIITAFLDKERNRWREGAELHVTSQGFVRADGNDVQEDDLGALPRFDQVRSIV